MAWPSCGGRARRSFGRQAPPRRAAPPARRCSRTKSDSSVSPGRLSGSAPSTRSSKGAGPRAEALRLPRAVSGASVVPRGNCAMDRAGRSRFRRIAPTTPAPTPEHEAGPLALLVVDRRLGLALDVGRDRRHTVGGLGVLPGLLHHLDVILALGHELAILHPDVRTSQLSHGQPPCYGSALHPHDPPGGKPRPMAHAGCAAGRLRVTATGTEPSRCVRTTSATSGGSTLANRRIVGQTSPLQHDMSSTATVRRDSNRARTSRATTLLRRRLKTPSTMATVRSRRRSRAFRSASTSAMGPTAMAHTATSPARPSLTWKDYAAMRRRRTPFLACELVDRAGFRIREARLTPRETRAVRACIRLGESRVVLTVSEKDPSCGFDNLPGSATKLC